MILKRTTILKRMTSLCLCGILILVGNVGLAGNGPEECTLSTRDSQDTNEIACIESQSTITLSDISGELIDEITIPITLDNISKSRMSVESDDLDENIPIEYSSSFSTDIYIDTENGHLYTPDEIAQVISSESRSKEEIDKYGRSKVNVTIYFVIGNEWSGGANVDYIQLLAVAAAISNVNGANVSFSNRKIRGEWWGWDIVNVTYKNGSTGWGTFDYNTPRMLATSPKLEWGSGLGAQITGKASCVVSSNGSNWNLDATVATLYGPPIG